MLCESKELRDVDCSILVLEDEYTKILKKDYCIPLRINRSNLYVEDVERITQSVYLKFMIPSLFYGKWGYTVYLDCDTILRDGYISRIDEFLESIEYIGMVPHVGVPKRVSAITGRYYNSGMIIFNNAKSYKLAGEVFNRGADWWKKVVFEDQCAFNLLFRDLIYSLPYYLNCTADNLFFNKGYRSEEVYCYHLTGLFGKPGNKIRWKPDLFGLEENYEYLGKKSFYTESEHILLMRIVSYIFGFYRPYRSTPYPDIKSRLSLIFSQISIQWGLD